MADLPAGHVRNCRELRKTHDSRKLLWSCCIASLLEIPSIWMVRRW